MQDTNRVKTKFITYAGVAALLGIAFVLGVSAGVNHQFFVVQEESRERLEGASLMIDYGDGRIETYHELSGATVFDVLKGATGANGIELEYQDYGGELGVFIESIGGVGKDPAQERWWQFWVNNKYSQVGVSSFRIEPGDVITFKFAKGQE